MSRLKAGYIFSKKRWVVILIGAMLLCGCERSSDVIKEEPVEESEQSETVQENIIDPAGASAEPADDIAPESFEIDEPEGDQSDEVPEIPAMLVEEETQAFTPGANVVYEDNNYIVEEDSYGYLLRNPDTGQLLSLDLKAEYEENEQNESIESLLSQIASIYQIAHDTPYQYGDSQSDIPCEDGVISCDRLIARALWDIDSLNGYSFRDQQPHGMTIFSEDSYLTSHGFHRVEDITALQRGDIILYTETATGIVHHTCILTAYDSKTGICGRYDAGITGSTPKFYRDEPIVEYVLYDYDYEKEIQHVYRLDGSDGLYSDNELILRDKTEADPAELSQRWVLTEEGDRRKLIPVILSQRIESGIEQDESLYLYIE